MHNVASILWKVRLLDLTDREMYRLQVPSLVFTYGSYKSSDTRVKCLVRVSSRVVIMAHSGLICGFWSAISCISSVSAQRAGRSARASEGSGKQC